MLLYVSIGESDSGFGYLRDFFWSTSCCEGSACFKECFAEIVNVSERGAHDRCLFVGSVSCIFFDIAELVDRVLAVREVDSSGWGLSEV